MLDGKFTIVPVTEGFHTNKIIGELRILTDALPLTPDFVFTIGYQALDISIDDTYTPTKPYIGAYKLCEVSIQHDDKYVEYLRYIGKLSSCEQ